MNIPHEIRLLGSSALSEMCDIERCCFPDDPWPECMLASALEGYGSLALGLYTHRLIGCALGRTVADEAELHSIAIRPGHRRKGYGLILLDSFLETCTRQQVRTVWLEVRASNHPAIRLYAGHGFRATGRRPGYYSDGEDALIYCCHLPRGQATGSSGTDRV